MELKDTLKLDEDQKAWVVLEGTSKAVDRACELELEPLGLSPTAAGVLYLLKTAEETVTPSKLSRWMFREAHTMSGLINRMEKQGLVKRAKDLERKNMVRVTLTEKGEQALRGAWDAALVSRITSCLSKQERDNLKAYLKKLQTRALEIMRDLQPLPYT